jgi:F0F1-type ATP synthase assembly protein I
VAKSQDDRSPYAKAMGWTSRITSISMEMVVPALIGYWLDQRWETHHLLLILGMVLGFATAMSSLMQIARGANSSGWIDVHEKRLDDRKTDDRKRVDPNE